MLRRAAGLLAVAVLMLLAACQSSSPPENADQPGAGGTAAAAGIETAFGTVTPPKNPERVVALGWADAETALALGVQPVGAADWLAFGGDGVGPWAEGRYDEPPKILGTLELSYEQVAALEPDLILDTKAAGDAKRNRQLSRIAPTVGIPPGAENYATGLQKQVTMIGAALGVPEKAEKLLAEVDQQFADAAAEHPEFDGKTVTVAARTSEGWGAYIATTDRVRFMERLGFRNSPAIDDAEPEGFSVRVSEENLDLLDADLLVVMPIGVGAEEVSSDPVFEQVPAVQQDRFLILEESAISKAYSTNSLLSIEYALDRVTPRLAEAVGK